MTIEGTLVEKFDTQQIKDTFQKREFVVEYAENPQYPEFIKFELIQSNCQQIDAVQKGDLISVNFNLKGRKWTDAQGETKYFNSLQAWRVDKKSSTPPMQDTPPPPTQQWSQADQTEEDDLPF